MRSASGPGGSGVSFGHSDGGGGDGAGGGVEGAVDTWAEGLDDGLAEHGGWGGGLKGC